MASLFIFNCSATRHSLNLQSERAKVHTLSTFASILSAFVCSFLASLYTLPPPLLTWWTSLQRKKKHLYYPRRFDFFIVCLPQSILIGLWFYKYIYQSSHKTMLFYYSRFLRLILCHQYNRNTLNFLYCSSKYHSSGLRLKKR